MHSRQVLARILRATREGLLVARDEVTWRRARSILFD
jgi:hypothetical protein